MEIKELGHAVLYVRDLDRSAAFYRDVLGFRQIGDRVPGMPAVAFSSGRTHHELLLIEVGPHAQAIPGGRRVGLYHLGLKVGDTDEELVAAYEAVRDAGAVIVGTAACMVSVVGVTKDPMALPRLTTVRSNDRAVARSVKSQTPPKEVELVELVTAKVFFIGALPLTRFST